MHMFEIYDIAHMGSTPQNNILVVSPCQGTWHLPFLY